MERRQFLGNSGLLAASLAVASFQSAQSHAADAAKTPTSPLLLQNPDVLKLLPHFAESASSCATKGDLCVAYCEEQISKGETGFANCLVAANQMVILCKTVSKLAAMKSVRLTETLDACSAACKACKEACDEHKAHWKHGMHLECKACAEHCEKLVSEVAALKAAIGKS